MRQRVEEGNRLAQPSALQLLASLRDRPQDRVGFWVSFSCRVRPTDQPAIALNPSLLVWAREQSGYGLDRVARRLQVKEERVAEWEAGERQPTTREVENLARMFHRPRSVFFMPRPPQLPPLAMAYRRLPDVELGHESPELRLALRHMLTRRDDALNLMKELGREIPELTLRASLRETPASVCARLRQAAGVSAETQLEWGNEWEACVSGGPWSDCASLCITSVNASRYLDLKFEHFDKLRAHLRGRLGSLDR